MIRRGKRWLSIIALGLLAFAQANGVAAGCLMDCGRASQPQAADESHATCDALGHCGTHRMPMSVEDCSVGNTTDAQAVGRLAVMQPLAVPAMWYVLRNGPHAKRVALPVGASRRPIPLRILLHSFLI